VLYCYLIEIFLINKNKNPGNKWFMRYIQEIRV